MLKVGDSVHIFGRKESLTITNIVDDVAIVQYAGGIRQKVPLNSLVKERDAVMITPRMYDNAVLSMISDMQESAFEEDKDPDYIIRVTNTICGLLKERIFNLD